MRPIERILFGTGAVFLAGWFFALAGAGLGAWFSGDDLMNLYGAWTTPWSRLLLDNLAFFRPSFRPLGALWYRAIFAWAGFDPLPFHAAAFAILGVNLWLTYALARRLSGSREVAGLTALLASYNARFANLYFDTGAIYDVLCYGFYCGALLYYVRVRQRGGRLSPRQLAVFAILLVCALNAKEMAVTLPLLVLAYEAFWHPPAARHPGALRQWFFDHGRGCLAGGILAGLYALGRTIGPGGLANQPGYEVTLSWTHAASMAAHYGDEIFYQYGWFTPTRIVGLWLAMMLLAWRVRSRTLWFAWVWLTVSLAPLLVVAPRGGSAAYICLFGWALYGATLLEWVTRLLVSRPIWPYVRHSASFASGTRPAPGRDHEGAISRYAKPALVFLLTAAVLWPFHRFEGRFTSEAARRGGEQMRRVHEAVHQARPAFRPGARILFLNAPVGPVHDLAYLVKLGYDDPTLEIDRATGMPAGQSSYDYVLDYAARRFLVLKRP